MSINQICVNHYPVTTSETHTIFEMMKLAILVFCVAVAAAGIIPSAVQSTPTNAESDMETAATHHEVYDRNIGIYAGALPSVYPSGFGAAYPAPYYPSYSPGYGGGSYGGGGYGGGGYGYPYRPYPSYGLGVFAG